jgi:PAS domain S-box-containing protein
MDASPRVSASLNNSGDEPNAELQTILNAVMEGVCGLDGEGRATFCNDALVQITGYGAKEIVGQKIHELLHPSHPGITYSASHGEPRRGADVYQRAHRVGESLWRKNGTCFPAECWLCPLLRPASRTTHVLIVRDITEIQRTREVLVHSAKTFRRILANAPDVAWTSDRQGRTIYISPKVQAVLGYTKEEIYNGGEHLRMGCIHPADFGRVHQAYEALFEQQIRFQEEYRIRRKDGVWIWVQDRASSTHQENGVRYADGFLCEITQRKEPEAELRFRTAFLEAQANSTIDGILVVDPRGRSLLQNRRFDEMFQIPTDLLAVKEDGKMLGYVVTLIKDEASFLARVDYLYKHPHETSRDEIELNNGTFLDRYSSPVIDKEGVYYGRIWIFRDITERKRNQDELQQLSLAVEQSPVSVVITDPEGNISYVNRKFTDCTGCSREEVAGKNPRLLNSGVARPELYRELWSTIKQGRVWHGELCNKKKSGEIFWEAVTITPITDPKGIITHFLAVKEDITDRRRAEREICG